LAGSRASGAMNAILLVVAGNTTKSKVALKLPCVLGRSREADVTVPHPLISRRHCELSEADGLLMLRDLVSLNGTMIGGRRITSAPLLPDAEFTIGPLTFRVVYDYGGDLESLPPINYVDGVADAEGIEFADADVGEVEAPLPSIEQPSAQMPASLSDSDVVEVPDFVALADADPDDMAAAILVEPDLLDAPPVALATPPWPTVTPDKLPTEFVPETVHELTTHEASAQSIFAEPDSPWATEAPEVESAKRPTVKQKSFSDQDQAVKTPLAVTKQPNYGDEVDPEFGSFLEDLR
jgi:predicted component of type VI protein secretion system